MRDVCPKALGRCTMREEQNPIMVDSSPSQHIACFFDSEIITYIVHSRGVMLGDRKPIPIGVCHWTNPHRRVSLDKSPSACVIGQIPIGVCHWTNHNSTIRKITEIKRICTLPPVAHTPMTTLAQKEWSNPSLTVLPELKAVREQDRGA
jgi:hypothetical protein